MKIAVTGATGFVGRSVLTELSRRGIKAVATVRSSPDAALAAGANTVVRLDLSNPPQNAFEQLGSPDVLVHLAWGGLPNYGSLHHFEQELPSQYLFLKTMVESGLQNLLVAGTCFEYGMRSGPLGEEVEAHPSNPYGFAKDTLRRQLEYLKVSLPFNLVWGRLFYLYGQGQAESSLFRKLTRAVDSGEPSFDMSGGEQLRDFLPVTEAAKMLVTLALKQRDIGVINICSGVPVSVRRLVEGWIEANGWSILLNLGRYAYPDYEPMAFWGDRRKLDGFLEAD